MTFELSPNACEALIDGLGEDTDTDCPEACKTDPDSHCPHGYYAAMETLLRTEA